MNTDGAIEYDQDAYDADQQAIRILLLFALFTGALSLWFVFQEQQEKSFPLLRPGLYQGSVTNLSGRTKPQPILVLRDQTPNAFKLYFLMDESVEREIRFLVLPGREDIAPVQFVLSGKIMIMTGQEVRRGEYEGQIREFGTRRAGRWKLRMIEKPAEEGGIQPELLDEIFQEQQMASLGDILSGQEKRSEKLEEMVFEGTTLRERSASRLDALLKEITDFQQKIDLQTQRLEQALSELAIFQEIHPQGRLISLSEKIHNREEYLLEKQLVDTQRVFPGIQVEDLEKAKKVLTLEREIALEKERVLTLHRREQILIQSEQGDPGAYEWLEQ